MTRHITLKPINWDGFNGWEVFTGDDYLGLIGEYGTKGYKPYYRAYGIGDLDGHEVPVESREPLMSRDEAVGWLLDGDWR